MRWPMVGMALLAACAPSRDPSDPLDVLAGDVYAAVDTAWADAELPAIDDRGDYCHHLDSFAIATPATEAAFLASCPPDSEGRIGWACLDYGYLRGARTRLYPVAVMHPWLAVDRWASQAAHELTHAFTLCAGLGKQRTHADPRIWRPHAGSVEAVAVAALYAD